MRRILLVFLFAGAYVAGFSQSVQKAAVTTMINDSIRTNGVKAITANTFNAVLKAIHNNAVDSTKAASIAAAVSVNNYTTAVSFATGSGILTLQRSGLGVINVSLDGRYMPYTDTAAVLLAYREAIVANTAAIATHSANTSNPHSTTKAQVGLSNVDNTSDASKPVSTLQAAAITAAVAPLATTSNVNIALSAKQDASTAATLSGSQTLVNKTLSGASNTFSNISADAVVDGTTNKAYTATEKTKLAAISGTNTGDETGSTIRSKLGVTTLSGSNTGDQDLSSYAQTATVNTALALKQDASTAVTLTGTQTLTNKTIGADQIVDGTTNKAYTATEKTKLAGIATGATSNSSDATLLARANHTGSQAESTITGLVADLAGKQSNLAIINVKENGAVGDSTTDDRTALVNSFGSNRTVYLPTGKYRISSSISLSNITNLTIIGDNATIIGDTFEQLNFTGTSWTNTTIQGVRFISTKVNLTDTSDATDYKGLIYSQNVSIKNVKIINCFFKAPRVCVNGIQMINASSTTVAYDDITIDGNTFDSLGRMAVEVYNLVPGDTASRTRNLSISHNIVVGTGFVKTGILQAFSTSGDRIHISNNDMVDGNIEYGNGSNCEISHNNIMSKRRAFIPLSFSGGRTSKNLVISGNTVYSHGTGDNTILFDNIDYLTMTGNSFDAGKSVFYNIHKSNITGNTFKSDGDRVIELTANGTAKVTQNRFSNNTFINNRTTSIFSYVNAQGVGTFDNDIYYNTYINESTIAPPTAQVQQNSGAESNSGNPAQQNLILNSEDFTTASWNKFTATVTANADSVGDMVTATSSGYAVFQSFVTVPGTTYTVSWKAKRGTMTEMKYRMRDNTNGTDLAYPSYYSSVNSTSYTRMTYTFTAPTGCVDFRVYVLGADSGVTAGTTAYVDRVQVNIGTVAYDYAQTTTAAIQ